MTDADEPGELYQQDLENRNPTVPEALRALHLDVEFSEAVLQRASLVGSDSAQEAAAKVVCALAAADQSQPDEQQKRQKMAAESYALRAQNRPKATSSAYAGGKRHFQAWCTSRGESGTLSNLKIEEYARYICVTERVGAEKRQPSFKFCCGHILAVRDLRLEQISLGQIREEEVFNPWSLATVGSYMAAKYRDEKSALAEQALNVYMCKRMTHAQLARAMELALAHPKREWATLIRFSLAWACAAARRSADMLNMVFSGLCVHDFRVTTQDEPLVGVGPDPSRALAMVASQAAADRVVCELSGSRLHLGTLAKCHIMRAPASLGDKPMASSWFTTQVGHVLRDAGVAVELSEKGSAGKNTVFHHCKQYSLNYASLVGADYDDITHLASHERDVTKTSYLTLATAALHRMGGFGADFHQNHVLGRGQVAVPQSMRDLVLPGLMDLTVELLASPAHAQLLPVLQALYWLLEVWLQDLPLKLARFGRDYARLFPQETALVTAHPEWQGFYIAVLTRDAAVKADTRLSRDFKNNPRQGLNQILHGHPSALQLAKLPAVPKSQELLTKRERQGTLVFDLAGVETLRLALELYRTILVTKKRRWAGEGKRYAMAFSAFGHGVYSEFSRRAAIDGEERALLALEQERLSMVARRGSQLQALCNMHYKAYKAGLKQQAGVQC